jgi:hypothetical protein
MSIHIVTVMHSGTHLLQTILNHDQRFHGPDRLVRYHVHTEHNNDPADADFMFSSLRHPRRIAESWRRRHEDGKDHLTPQWLYEQLDKLMTVFDKHIDMYIHMDSIDTRDSEVQAMGEMIGVNIATVKWDKADRDTVCNYKTHDVDIDDCPMVPSKYEDFYYRTIMNTKTLPDVFPMGRKANYSTMRLI